MFGLDDDDTGGAAVIRGEAELWQRRNHRDMMPHVMQMFVTVGDCQTMTLYVLRWTFENEAGSSYVHKFLSVDGRVLSGSSTVQECGIDGGSTVNLVEERNVPRRS